MTIYDELKAVSDEMREGYERHGDYLYEHRSKLNETVDVLREIFSASSAGRKLMESDPEVFDHLIKEISMYWCCTGFAAGYDIAYDEIEKIIDKLSPTYLSLTNRS